MFGLFDNMRNQIMNSVEDAKKKEEERIPSDWQATQQGGFRPTADMARRAGDFNYGQSIGEKEFIQDPEMKRLKQLREQYAKGYSGEELGALRQLARNEISGAQSAQERKLSSGLGRAGVGGARAAAIKSAQGQEGMKAVADAERKMALDSAQMQRQGASDLQDFIFRQKYGKLGTGAGFAQLGASDYAAQQARIANQNQNQGVCCFIFLEARYGNGTMDDVVRKFRDENLTDKNKRGYYKLSEVLVPLMRKSKSIKFLVRALMTDPLVAYGRAYYGQGSKLGLVFAPVKNFWLKTFDYLGDDHAFIRENGEVV